MVYKFHENIVQAFYKQSSHGKYYNVATRLTIYGMHSNL